MEDPEGPDSDSTTDRAETLEGSVAREDAEAEAEVALPKTPLLPHQTEGLRWMIRRETEPAHGVRGGVLADEAGLGKTLTTLALIESDEVAARNPRERPTTMVCCLASLVNNWVADAGRHRPELAVRAFDDLRDPPSRPNEFRALLNSCNALVISYDQLAAAHRRLAERIDRDADALAAKRASEGWRGYGPGEAVRSIRADVLWSGYRRRALDHVAKEGSYPDWLETSGEFEPRELLFLSGPYRRVVLDEAHYVRNHATSVARAVRALVSERRWCLSATIVNNRLDDLFMIFSFLRVAVAENRRKWAASKRPSRTFSVFEARESTEARVSDPKTKRLYNAEFIDRALDALMLRRGKDVLGAGDPAHALPPLAFEKIVSPFLDPREKAAHDEAYDKCRLIHAEEEAKRLARGASASTATKKRKAAPKPKKKKKKAKAKATKKKGKTSDKGKEAEEEEEEEEGDDEGEEGSPDLSEAGVESEFTQDTAKGRRVLGFLCRARQACTLPDYRALKLPVARCTKAALLAAVLRDPEAMGRGDCAVIFTQWNYCLKDLAEHIEASCPWKKRCLVLHGGLNRAQRWEVLREFEALSPNAHLLTPYAVGGTGLNMTRANRAILLDHWFNPTVEIQAWNRVWRLGQTRPVRVISLAIEGSVDEDVLRLQEEKLDLAERLTPYLDGAGGLESVETSGSAESVFAKLLFGGRA